MADKPICKIDGCDKPVRVKRNQLCNAHSLKEQRYGDPLAGRQHCFDKPKTSDILSDEPYWAFIREKFRQSARKTSGCWEWQAGLSKQGYGKIYGAGRNISAHRFSYMLHVGLIPEGLVLDHKCRNRKCVNPSHLEPVTNEVNVLRGVGFAAVNARKTHCKNGHKFTAENTVVRHDGGRRCKVCSKAASVRARLKRSPEQIERDRLCQINTRKKFKAKYNEKQRLRLQNMNAEEKQARRDYMADWRRKRKASKRRA